MAWQITKVSLESAKDRIDKAALRLNNQVTILRDLALSVDVERNRFIGLQAEITGVLAEWVDALSTVNNLALDQYIKDQYDDQTLDPTADYIAMRDAATALRAWIFNNFPTDAGTGAALEFTVDLEGTRTPLVFTPAQLTGFVTVANTFLATMV